MRCSDGPHRAAPAAQGLGNQCCGMLFDSRGFKEAAAVKAGELEVREPPHPSAS